VSATPTRIETDLYESAKSVGALMSRSAAQQVNHWARIGRELEAADGVSQRDIARVLAGVASYDALSAREKAVVRAEWDERITANRLDLNFEDEFIAAGISWVESDDDGAAVVRDAEPR
jgi:hypothetical protein